MINVDTTDGFSNGMTLPTAGLLIRRTKLISGTIFVLSGLTNFVRILMVGGGGGGGYSSGSNSGAGGGGGAGGYLEKFVAVNSLYVAYVIGTAGAGGVAATPANATAGGDTTLTLDGVIYTAKGGGLGVSNTGSATATTFAGGAGGVVGTNGDINASGMPGDAGFTTIAVTTAVGGCGGSGQFGGGGVGPRNAATSTAGNAGTGNGSGGSGACTVVGGGQNGGAGTIGLIMIEEYQ